jgi:hypothetical protein
MKSFTRSLVVLQSTQAFTPVVLNKQVHQSLSVSGFTGVLDAEALVVSRVFAIQYLTLPSAAFSIRADQVFVYENFFVCVKWVEGEDVDTEGDTFRYSLWKPSGATLQVAPYAGQIIPTTLRVQLEFWSTSESTEAPVVPSFSIITDVIEAPASCCSESGTVLANSICSIGQPDTLDEKFQTCL